MVISFCIDFCNKDDSINWEKLVNYNSGSPKRKAQEKIEHYARIIYNELQKNPDISNLWGVPCYLFWYISDLFAGVLPVLMK